VANEIVYSGLGDQRLTEVLSSEVLLQLADRNALPNHPALFYGGDAMGRGSLAVKVPIVGLNGFDAMASVGEGASIANTALTDTSVVCTVGRYGKAYTATDLARLSNPMGGVINAQAFAQDAITSDAMLLTSLLANLMDNFSATVGSTGVDADLATFMAAQDTLQIANVAGPYMCILHSRQWRDIISDIALAVGGTAQFVLATPEQIAVRGGSYQGNLLGTDVFVSNQVPSANGGADRGGGMFGRGAVIWCDSTIVVDNDPNLVLINGKLLFERERVARASTTGWVSTTHKGVIEGIDLAGVSIITDF
jgi:hypothetical protein